MIAIVLVVALVSGLAWLMVRYPRTVRRPRPEESQPVTELNWTALDESQLRRLLDRSP